MTIAAVFATAFASAAHSSILDEVCDADEAADMAVASIRTPQVLESRQRAWRKYWLDALGGMPERTPLNARVTGTVECDGFRMENVVFEPQLFSSVRFTDAPPSWTEMATNPDPRLDSFAVAVWGALREYDWSDLTPKEDLK